MDTNIKSLWIQALESGQYTQARGYLRREDSYCCLGVLCTLLPSYGHFEGNSFVTSDGPPHGGELPYTLREQVGLTVQAMADLISMNDEQEKDFAQIAQYIREYL